MNPKISLFAIALLAPTAIAGHLDLGPLTAEIAAAESAVALLEIDASSASLPQADPARAPTLEELKARRLAHVIIPAPARTVSTPTPSSVPASAPPQHDPTLISVPSNTLGPGEPLWVRSDWQAAQARIAQAEAAIVEREAARSIDDDYDDLVVYGPHAPGWAVRGWYGNGIRPHGALGRGRGLVRPIDGGRTTTTNDDVFDQAQIHFGNVAYPKIGGPIEAQQEAQRRFGATARPPIVRIQNDLDRAQLNMRKAQPKPK